ncbi:MAG: S8/S53 family peptidase [Verrucomicrobia bacterium]|nr:S8/S53 family peptidase [Verrucomicrobiota bacterium]
MQAILTSQARLCPSSHDQGAVRRRIDAAALFRVLPALLLMVSSAYAEVTTVELSPLVTKSQLIGPLDGSKQISLLLALPSSDPAGLADFVYHVSTSGDPLYHQYITPQQFAHRFGGSVEDYAYLKNWTLAKGFQISQESTGRINLVVRGSVSLFQEVFKTQLNTYRASDGETFYSASVKPVVPVEIASRVSSVIGLTSGKRLAPLVQVAKTLGEDPLVRSDKMRADTAGGTGPGGTYSAKDLRTAYSIPSFGQLDKNTVIAVFEQGGYNVSDTAVYFKRNNLPPVKQTSIAVDNSSVQVEKAIELEACLDIDTIVGINPYISEVLVYVDDYNNDPFNVAMPAAIAAVANDDKAQILSISYGQDEGYQGNNTMDAENTALLQCAAEGITVLASSGDDGAYGSFYYQPYNVSDPASQPYVTGVGGTTLYTGPGEAYIDEEVWNDLGDSGGSTGGGISSYWSIPSFQSTIAPSGYVAGNGGSSTMRNVPDVGAVADPRTGVGVYVKDQGGWVQVGGTSLSCPIWAGYLSTINAAFSYAGMGNLGFFNPALYGIGSAYFFEGYYPANWMYDITVGSNGYAPQFGAPGYTNGLGYSNTTGNGSIWGGGLAAQILISQTQPGKSPRAFWFNTPTVKRKSIEVTWANSVGAAAYVMALYHQGPYVTAVETFVTKKTNLKIAGLTPNTQYNLWGWSINSSGYYGIQFPIQFQTPQ